MKIDFSTYTEVQIRESVKGIISTLLKDRIPVSNLDLLLNYNPNEDNSPQIPSFYWRILAEELRNLRLDVWNAWPILWRQYYLSSLLFGADFFNKKIYFDKNKSIKFFFRNQKKAQQCANLLLLLLDSINDIEINERRTDFVYYDICLTNAQISSLLQLQSQKNVNFLQNPDYYLIKTIRTHELDFWLDFIESITHTAQSKKPGAYRKKFNKDYYSVAPDCMSHSSNRFNRFPEVLEAKKLELSSPQSCTLGTKKYLPKYFGHAAARKDRLVGVLISTKHALINRAHIYDGGTVLAPWRSEDLSSINYISQQLDKDFIFSDIECFVDKLENRFDKNNYNEVLARIRFDEATDAIVVFSNNFYSRALAVERERSLRAMLKKRAQILHQAWNENYRIPILFYPEQPSLGFYSYGKILRAVDRRNAILIFQTELAEHIENKDFEFLYLIENLTEVFEEKPLITKILEVKYHYILLELVKRALAEKQKISFDFSQERDFILYCFQRNEESLLYQLAITLEDNGKDRCLRALIKTLAFRSYQPELLERNKLFQHFLLKECLHNVDLQIYIPSILNMRCENYYRLLNDFDENQINQIYQTIHHYPHHFIVALLKRYPHTEIKDWDIKLFRGFDCLFINKEETMELFYLCATKLKSGEKEILLNHINKMNEFDYFAFLSVLYQMSENDLSLRMLLIEKLFSLATKRLRKIGQVFNKFEIPLTLKNKDGRNILHQYFASCTKITELTLNRALVQIFNFDYSSLCFEKDRNDETVFDIILNNRNLILEYKLDALNVLVSRYNIRHSNEIRPFFYGLFNKACFDSDYEILFFNLTREVSLNLPGLYKRENLLAQLYNFNTRSMGIYFTKQIISEVFDYDIASFLKELKKIRQGEAFLNQDFSYQDKSILLACLTIYINRKERLSATQTYTYWHSHFFGVPIKEEHLAAITLQNALESPIKQKVDFNRAYQHGELKKIFDYIQDFQLMDYQDKTLLERALNSFAQKQSQMQGGHPI